MNKVIKMGLVFCLFFGAAKAQVADDSLSDNEPVIGRLNNENASHYTHYSYYTLTLFTGAGVSIPFHQGSGAVTLGFPYTSTDAAGVTTNNTFQSNPGSRVSSKIKPYLDFFGFEAGGLNGFYSLDFSTRTGITFSTGYGRMWYFNGWGEHGKDIEDKQFVFKASMNVAWSEYTGSTLLGTIDNTNKTIDLLGYTANPTFDVTTTTTDGDGNSYSETDTYAAKNLNVYYSQTEWALAPEIAIGNNPYKGGGKRFKVLWNLSLGYNFPFLVKDGIQLQQSDGSGNSSNLNNSLIRLNTPGATFLYNGKPTTSTPFRFSGLYIAFSIRMGSARCR